MLLLLSMTFLDLHGFLFLTHKSEAFNFFKHFCKRVKKKIGSSIFKIRSDHGGEFENEISLSFVRIRALHALFWHQEHHNKIVLLKGKIGLCRK